MKLTMSGGRKSQTIFLYFFMHIHPFFDVQFNIMLQFEQAGIRINKNRFQESAFLKGIAG